MIEEEIIGTDKWWEQTDLWSQRGLVSCIMRLLEQELVSRSKAIELVQAAVSRWPMPKAPWERMWW